MVKKIKLAVITVLIINAFPTLMMAQTLTDYSSNSRRPRQQQPSSTQRVDPGPNPDVPVDGGIALLLAAGAAFGIKKTRDARMKLAQTV